MSNDGGDATEPALSHFLGDEDEAHRTLLDLAVAAAGIGTFDWDLTTGSLTWDERLLELFGYDPTEFAQTIEAFNARLHPDDLDPVAALLQKAIDTCGDYSAEYRVVLPTGTLRWVAARGRALCDEAGNTVRLLGSAWDISERQAGQDRIAQIIEQMAIGFIAMDDDWVMTHVNAETERVTGIVRDELIGHCFWDVFPAAIGTEFETRYRRAVSSGQSEVFEAFYPEPLNVWVEVRATPSPEGLLLYFVDITERRAVQQRAERASERERLLNLITEELGGELDADGAVGRLTRLVVPAVADMSIVTLIDDDRAAGTHRGLRSSVSWHEDPGLRAAADAYAQSRLSDNAVIAQALETGQTQLLNGNATAQAMDVLRPGPMRDAVSALAPEAVAVLPLPGRTGPVGMLTLANGAERGPFTSEDLATMRHVAARAGLVLDNARLYRQQRDLAEGFQRSLLTPPPEPDHLQIVVRYVPAGQAVQVGGDWYDALMQPSGATVLVIGDVVGHDVAAAAAMGQIRSIVRTIGALDSEGPAAVIRQTERVMATLRSDILATAIVARLEQTEQERALGLTRLRWSNAGHPPPAVISSDGAVRLLTTSVTDLMLGVDPDALRHESQLTLERDAVVLFYSDGLIERRNQHLDDGLDRLQRTLAGLAGRDLDDLCDELLARMLPDAPDDDVALVAVRLHPQDRPRPAQAGPKRVPLGLSLD
ncbi:SpoIIE family protein phosphatase [Blastococcus goldschmidtiae]|uniref:SpoIIE family protein phosphatase n=1 Tax=Blastococcus goldschmidtiae TaxID=3075546 RepID=A0ABU2KCU6_9ACTN|nr:SpoIIE family protein phosphatase [Blastococcus sp. DSM 46792]MDT0278013.1 SpoIIE family protein phosphatase [Blastococcus sp. DSM 46792]